MSRLTTKIGLSLTALVLICTGCEPEESGFGKIEFVEETQSGVDSPIVGQSKKDEENKKPIPSKDGPWPQFVAHTAVHQFGRMPMGAQGEHSFIIVNEGDADLELSTGRPSCNCTLFELESNIVKPGETTKLKIKWTAKTPSERWEHGGAVFSNDPKATMKRFTIKGVVDAPVKILPGILWNLGGIAPHEEGYFAARVASKIYDDFVIEDITSDNEYVSFDIEPMPKEELTEVSMVQGYKVIVNLAKGAPAGPFEAAATMRISCDKEPVVVQVRGMKEGPIKVVDVDQGVWVNSSGTVRLGRFQARDGRKASMIFTVSNDILDADLEIGDVNSSPRYVRVELEPMPTVSKSVRRYRLNVEVPPGSPRKALTADDPGTIQLSTNIPGQNAWKIFLRFTSY